MGAKLRVNDEGSSKIPSHYIKTCFDPTANQQSNEPTPFLSAE